MQGPEGLQLEECVRKLERKASHALQIGWITPASLGALDRSWEAMKLWRAVASELPVNQAFTDSCALY
jgi:hypothetical protein